MLQMNLVATSILRPVFAWILMPALIIFGAIAATRLGVSQLPDIDFPILTIQVNYEGATPEVVESALIMPIEERLLGIEGLKEMRATARQGSGQVVLELDIRRNVDVALQEVQAALSQLRLPSGIDPPIIRKTNPEDQPFVFIGVYAEKPLREVLRWVDIFLLDQLRFIPGIGEASITGFPERNLRIWPDLAQMRRLDLTVLDLLTAVETQHLENTAGQFVRDKDELRVRWRGEAQSPEDLARVRILRRGNENIFAASRPLTIGDVARVEDGLSDERRMARIEGRQAITIGIRKQRGQNEVALGEAVHEKVAALQAQLPETYKLKVVVDMSLPTRAVVNTTWEKLVVAVVVTILVCLTFLGNWQAAVNIIFSIPTSIVGTFLIVYWGNFTLNLFTLLALTLAVSIVVDDAIMLLENIVRHHRMGKSAAQAAYDGSLEILPAASAATLAVVAVFLPVVVMDGVIGKFFLQFGVVMSAAVLLSLVEAVTITPMRSAAILSDNAVPGRAELTLERLFEHIAASYRLSLTWVLRHPAKIAAASALLFALSLLLVLRVRQEFVPMQDQDYIFIAGQANPGASLEATRGRALAVEAIVRQHPEVTDYLLSVGAGGPAAEINQFFMPVKLRPRGARRKNHRAIIEELRQEFKILEGVRISLRDFSNRGLTSGRQFPVSFNVFGPDLDVLDEKVQQIIERMNSEGLTQDIDTDFKRNFPELQIQPDRAAMAARSVTIQSVATTLEATVAGLRGGRYTADGRRFDIRIRLPQEKISSARDIGQILVRNATGNTVPLSQLVVFSENRTYQAIHRVNRQRSIGIFGNLQSGKSQSAVLARIRQIARELLPPGYSLALEGSAAGLGESFRSLHLALFLGIIIAYMILAVQFNSFVQPISVLVALPFSVTGALLTLWLTDHSLNLFSFIGLIVLMGISKKNSILLVEFTNHVRRHGEHDVRLALISACPVRLRPVIMTSAATVFAALPLVIGNSVGQETRTPIGLTIMGGTLVSTLFTLFAVPCLYLVLSRLERPQIQPLRFERPSGGKAAPALTQKKPALIPTAERPARSRRR